MGMEEWFGRIFRTHYYNRTTCSKKITEIDTNILKLQENARMPIVAKTQVMSITNS